MTRLIAAVLAAYALGAWIGTPALARTITLADLRHEVGVADPRISPDGRSIAFVTSRPDYSANETRTDLVVIDIRTGNERKLTRDRTGVGSPDWSPDGTQIAFLADSGSGNDATSQLFVIPTTQGEAHQITHAQNGVDSFAWRPDGRAFAYITADANPNKPEAAHGLDAFVVGDNDYLAQSAPQPWHLWAIAATGGAAHRLTHGPKGLPPGEVILPQSVPDAWFSWSPDGRSIAYTKMPNAVKTDGVQSEIDIIDVATGVSHKLTQHEGEEAGGQYSPDGSRIMYWYPRAGSPIAFNGLFIAPSNGGTGTDATRALDRNIIGATWMEDSRSLLVLAHEGTWGRLWRIADDGSAQKLDIGEINPIAVPGGTIMSVHKSGAIAFSGSEPNRPVELYYMDSVSSKPRRLTDENKYFEPFTKGRVTRVDWTNDGFSEDGVLTYPPNFVAGKKYPLVLQIHGGPNWGSVEAFDTDYEGLSQLMAARGYLVFEPNYRGSDNVGNAYQIAIFNDAGDGPGRDVMAGIAAVEKLGIVDTSRIAVSGWSYGGYMTTWLIGHSKIWKCAVAGAAPTDAYVDYAISDYNVLGKTEFKGSPWTSRSIRQDYVNQSPLTYADRVTTPTLILHDTGDVRVPIVEDYEFFHALRDRGVTVEFVAYPVAGHYPGDPLRGEDIYRRWIRWLDRFLK